MLLKFIDTYLLFNHHLLLFLFNFTYKLPYALQAVRNRLFGILKWVASLLSGGKSTIHRLCASKRFHRLENRGTLTGLIALHLRFSSTLQAEARIIFNAPKNNGNNSGFRIDLPRTAKIIALRKGIPLESRAFQFLLSALVRIVEIEELRASLDFKSKTEYKTDKHKPLLFQLWANLHNDTAKNAPSLPSEDWKELGFQGTDPSTDFRGMGLLGLEQLLSFSNMNGTTNTKKDKSQSLAHSIYQQSKLGQVGFPFACVGINITAFIHSLTCNSHSLDRFYYQSGETPLHAAHAAYAQCFQLFNELWIELHANNVMDFNRVFEAVKVKFIKANY